MHSFLDQISALLSTLPNNSLQNNELYRQLPASELFSSLFSHYVEGADNANLAASGGNIVLPSLAQESIAAESGPVLQNFGPTASDQPEATVLPNVTLNAEPVEQALRQNNVQIERASVDSIGQDQRDVIAATSRANINEFESLAGSQGTRETISTVSKTPARVENNVPTPIPVQTPTSTNQTVNRNLSNDAPTDPLPNTLQQSNTVERATRIADKTDIPEQRVDLSLRTRDVNKDAVVFTPATKQSADTTKIVNNAPLSETQLANRTVNPPIINTGNDAVNLLDPRERLLTPTINNATNLGSDVQKLSDKVLPEQTEQVVNQKTENTNRLSYLDRFTSNTVPNDQQSEPLQPRSHDTVDIRKENVIASATLREQNELNRYVDRWTGLQYQSEELQKLSNVPDRSVLKQDHTLFNQPSPIAEYSAAPKFIEINIDQKTPVIINISADTLSSLKPLNADSPLLPPKEVQLGDTVATTLKTSEIRNGNDIAEQIAWAHRNNTQHVRISITPEHLGTIDIRIDDAAEGLNIQFIAQSIQTKDALEMFMPRLKDMLEQSGLNLQNASVSQQGEGRSSFNLAEQSKNGFDQQASEDEPQFSQTRMENKPASGSSDQLLDAFA